MENEVKNECDNQKMKGALQNLDIKNEISYEKLTMSVGKIKY